MHTPVLLQEVIDGLQVRDKGRYIDATVGEAGHMKAILAKGAYVLGIDQDKAQIDRLRHELASEKATLVCANFASIEEAAKNAGFVEVDGILFDLGISWRQLSESGKGLSYKADNEDLDMRLSQACQLTASDILNTYTQEELYAMLARNSEEVRSQDIAAAIVESRKRRKLVRVRDLKAAIDKATNGSAGAYARIFQALRIQVNDEFAHLEAGLGQAVRLLNQHGRIAVITFHSVEDRMVKRFIRSGGYRQITKKAIAGDRTLSFERSAKLRIFGL